MNPSYFTQLPPRQFPFGTAAPKSTPTSSQSIVNLCQRISSKGDRISTFDFKRALDELVRHLQTISDQEQRSNYLNQVITTLLEVPPTVLSSILDHELLTLVRTRLVEALKQWHRVVHLSDSDLFTFWNITKLLRKLPLNSVTLKAYSSWLSDARLLETVATSLNDLATTNKYFKDQELKLFIRLLNVYDSCQDWLTTENIADQDRFQALLDPIVKCLTCQHVTDAFLKIDKPSESMKTKEKFFLIKCSNFLLACEGPRFESMFTELLSLILPQYETLLTQLISSADRWQRPMIRGVNQLLKLLVHIFDQLPSLTSLMTTRLTLIDHILKLLDTPAFYRELSEKLSNPKTSLFHTAVTLLVLLANEPIIAEHIKQKQVTETFLRLKSASYPPLVQNTYNLLARVTSESDIKTMKDVNGLLSQVIRSLKENVNSDLTTNAEQIQKSIETLKGFTQHDQVKEEIVKQNFLPFLLECTTKVSHESLILLLETIWSLTFLPQAALVIRQHTGFLEQVKTISQGTNDDGLQKAADGLKWKLVDEPALLERAARQKSEDVRTEVIVGTDEKGQVIKQIIDITPAERTFEYDMMISYCHADKDLVYQIFKFLTDQQFKIWIDLNHMHGPAMSAMADAVENSEFIIMCMSSSYKQSTYCQAEAEYAFNCKRRIVPLIVRPNYRADGWLGFLLGSRIYVDYGRFEFDVACEKLMHEIQLQQKRAAPSKVDAGVKAQEMPMMKAAAPPPPVEVRAPVQKSPKQLPDTYLKRLVTKEFETKAREQWTESDVLDFLANHRLYEFMPLCEKMDGQALIQLSKMCASRSNRTYDLLNDELKASFHLKLPIGTYTRFLSIMETMNMELVPFTMPMIQPSYSTSRLPYDILVTSNAPASHMMNLLQQVLPRLPQGRPRPILY